MNTAKTFQNFRDNNTLFCGPGIVRTHSGNYIDVFHPEPEMFLKEDIAEGIAYCYRWRGQTKFGSKITVAEHSMNVAWRANNHNDFIAGLFHDASEGILADVPSPIKADMKLYKEIEARVMFAIALRFGFSWPLSLAVKRHDAIELHLEFDDCMLNDNYKALSPEAAKAAWLTAVNSIL